MVNPRNIHFSKGDLVQIPKSCSHYSLTGKHVIIMDSQDQTYRNGKMYRCLFLDEELDKFGHSWIHDYELIEDYYQF